MIELHDISFDFPITSDMRTHMTKSPIIKINRSKKSRIHKNPQLYDFKPIGFWYSFGTEWIEWVKSEMPEWMGNNLYEVKIQNKNILKINSSYHLVEFDNEFKVKNPINDIYCDFIDWKRVYEKYDGIEITPYNWDFRLKYMWYYSWDVASGCIWNV